MSRLGLSNNHYEIIAVVYTANFMTVIAEDLTHTAGHHEMRNGLGQFLSDKTETIIAAVFAVNRFGLITEETSPCSWTI